MRPETMVPCYVTLLCAVVVVVVVANRTESPVVDKEDATGNGNFSEPPRPPQQESYKSSDTYDERGMHHLYTLTRSFLAVVMDEGLPEVFVTEEFIKQPLQYTLDHKWELFEQHRTFIVLAIVGLVLAVLMPLVGLFICCCRCRKRRSVPDSKSDAWKRGILGLLMFILIVSMLFAIVCAFVTNEHAVDGVRFVPSQLNNAVDDVATYLNTTQEDAEYLLVDNFEELANRIGVEINNTGDRIRVLFADATGAISISQLLQIVERVDNITVLLTAIKDASVGLQNKGNDLAKKISDEQKIIKTTLQSCSENSCQTILDSDEFKNLTGRKYDQLPTGSVDNLKTAVEDLTRGNITGKIREGVESFNKIGGKVQEKVDELSKGINDKINAVGQKLKDTVKDYKYPVSTASIHQSIKGSEQWIAYADEYINYYRYAGIGVACVATVIFLFYSLGLMWGACSSHTGPCSASTGARLFLWGVTIFFLTYAIVQIPITAMYLAGVLVQRVGCDVAASPDSNSTQRLLQLAAKELQVDAPLVRFAANSLAKCRSGNWSLYQLLQEAQDKNIKLGDVKLQAVDFSVVENYRKEADLDKALEELKDKIKGASVDSTLLEGDAENLVDKMKSTSFDMVNVDDYLQKIEGSPTMTNISTFSQRLRAAASMVGVPKTAEELRKSADRLDGYNKDLVVDIRAQLKGLKKQLEELKGLVQVNGTPIATVVNETYHRVLEAQKMIKDNGTEKIVELGTKVAKELVEHVDEYIRHVKRQVTEVIGRCGPVSTAYDATVNSVCKGVLLPFNGYWVSVGWCLISGIPAMIIALLLVPLFRRLDPFLIPPSESDYISDTAYSERDTIPLAQVNRKARRGGGGRGVYDNRNGYLHDYSPEYRDHHPQRSVAGVTSPSVAYVPAPHYNYTRDPDLPPYKPVHGPTAPPVHDWGHGGPDYHKPPPYYFPGP